MASMFITQGAMHRSVNQRGVYMLELIEIVRHGLPLSELRTWLFFAAFAASGIAGWYSLYVIEHFKNKQAEE